MEDLVTFVKRWAGWAERSYMFCLPELIMLLVSMPDDKMGRFQVACPHMYGTKTGEKPDGSDILSWAPSRLPEKHPAKRYTETENCGMEELGAIWLVRATHSAHVPGDHPARPRAISSNAGWTSLLPLLDALLLC